MNFTLGLTATALRLLAAPKAKKLRGEMRLFKALLVEKDEHGCQANIRELAESSLPEGDVTVDIEYSTLNYKDALAITGKGSIVRAFPMVPGIDFSGLVQSSNHRDFKPGDRVVLNGWGVGEQHWGGLGQKAKVRGDWLVHLPASITSRQAMMIGTAGYTAMLSVMALERYGITPGNGDVLVTGAQRRRGKYRDHAAQKAGVPGNRCDRATQRNFPLGEIGCR